MVVASLPAGLSKMLLLCDVGGDAALPVADEAAGGWSSLRKGSGDSEEV